MVQYRFDGRKLSPEQQETLRFTAVRMHFGEGFTQKDTARALGVSRTEVVKWCRRYRESGEEGLRAKKRGRREGQKRSLEPEQCRETLKTIAEHTPDQLEMPYQLWTREAVRDLLSQRFGVDLALNTISNYLQRWGLARRKPPREVYLQRGGAARRWVEEDYPAIAAKARKDRGRICWCDRKTIATGTEGDQGKGDAPPSKGAANSIQFDLISAVTARGELFFLAFSPKIKQSDYLQFLERLVRDSRGKKVYLISDNLHPHHRDWVAEWERERRGEIRFYYPAPTGLR